jgi:hypothetical protein
MTEPLRTQVRYLGIGRGAQDILNSTFACPPGVSPHAARLIQGLQRIDGTAETPINTGMPTSEYRQGWKRVHEKTSAGPSTLTFGYCKVGVLDPHIIKFEAAMASIPMCSGYAYKRLRKGMDVELLKKANRFHVSKLRTIVLFEADFNFTNIAGVRKVGIQAEAHHSMAKEQGGSRKNHRAIKLGLNKCLTMDQLRLLKWPGVLCSNDMKSCYDRIVHAVASLCLQRQGISESEVVCMFSTLQNLEHTIQTAYGNSEETYGGDLWVIPMQGVYQGKGAGPLIWAVVSSPLLDIMREEGFGTFFKTSFSAQAIRFVGYAFVDDTDLVQTGKDGNAINLGPDATQSQSVGRYHRCHWGRTFRRKKPLVANRLSLRRQR